MRGSGPDDNAFIVDFLPASYIFHDFGHSIFNENLIRDFGLKAAGFGLVTAAPPAPCSM